MHFRNQEVIRFLVDDSITSKKTRDKYCSPHAVHMKILYVVNQYLKTSKIFAINRICELDQYDHDIIVFSMEELENNETYPEAQELNLSHQLVQRQTLSLCSGMIGTANVGKQ